MVFEGFSRRTILKSAAAGTSGRLVRQSIPAASFELSGPSRTAEVSVFEWFPARLQGALESAPATLDLTPYIQKALDEAPLGCTLVFPPGDYWVSSLRLTRQIDLKGHYARLVGRGGGNSDIFTIAIETAANGSGDARRMKIEGLIIYFAGQGRNALIIEAMDRSHDHASRDAMPNLNMLIERCGLSAPADGGGAALTIAGYRTQAHVLQHCDIENTVLIKCTDGVHVRDNIISGDNPGIIIDAYEGAYLTQVTGNLIVCRDGAINIRNGSQIEIASNQIEQPQKNNMGEHSSHLSIVPSSYPSDRCRIVGNNFGGGSNIKRAIYCSGIYQQVRNLLIDQNTFYPSGVGLSGADIEFTDAGVQRARVGQNFARGPQRSAANAAECVVRDNGVGSRGIVQRTNPFASGWSSNGSFGLSIRIDGVVELQGVVVRGAQANTESIFQLPVGMCPDREIFLTVLSDVGVGLLVIRPSGLVSWRGGAFRCLYLDGVTFRPGAS